MRYGAVRTDSASVVCAKQYAAGHKQEHERFGKKEGGKGEYGGQQGGNDQGGIKTAPDAAKLMRTEVLRNKVGQSVGAGAEAGGAEHKQFESRSKAVGDADALRVCEFVDLDLNDQVSHRSEAVLQCHGNSEQDEHFQKGTRKNARLIRFFRVQSGYPPQHEYQREDAGGALRDESCPGDTRNAPGPDH